jgi:4-amino-4-deoxy-L-arabinose transferase-like glycosyltransferase
MAAVDDLNQWETGVGSGVDSARVVLGAVMLTTAAVVALAAYVFGPAIAAAAAVAMLPILFVSTLRAPLDGCSVYGSLARRR